MRIRPLAAVSVVALSAFLLAGCAGAADESGADATSAAAASDLCSAASPSGDAVHGVTVTGEVGATPAVEFSTPLEVDGAQRTVAVEGEGEQLAEGDYVSYAVGVYDGSTGEALEESGFDGVALPAMSVTVGSGIDTYFGCASEGSRIVVTDGDSESGSYVYVLDVLDVIPADQWCVAGEPGDAFPTVTFAEDGTPTISIPAAEAPADVEVQVVEEGDGDVVQSGDDVTVDYTGVKWSDGTVFDSSYENGEPVTFATTGVVVGFQRALEGQKVGSKVLVSMPPACGYGEEGAGTSELAGQTLVFALEIIDTARAE